MMKYSKGDQVRLITTQQIGVVIDIIERRNQQLVKLLIDGKQKMVQPKFLEYFSNDTDLIQKELDSGQYGNLRDFEIYKTWIRLKKPYEGNLYSYLNSKTIFNPFQFKPLLKFLSAQSMDRLFIADEVGVGKTIECGIILTELLARKQIHWQKPVIVVCPNVLGPKWQKEMRDRFNLSFQLHSRDSFRLFLQNIKTKQLQPHQLFHIVSMQMLRSEEMLKELEEIDSNRQESVWSLVIVDEAHHMRNSGTNSNKLGHLLSSSTEMMIMLSATPLNLKDEDLFQLMHILNPFLYPDIQSFTALIKPVKLLNRFKQYLIANNPVHFPEMQKQMEKIDLATNSLFLKHLQMKQLLSNLQNASPLTMKEIVQYERVITLFNPLESSFTRTLKKEAFEQTVIREVLKVPIDLTAEEIEIYEEIIELAKSNYEFKGGHPAAFGFVTNLPRRMASSCLPAMKSYLQNGQVNQVIANQIHFEDYDIEDIEDDTSFQYEAYPDHLKEKALGICRKIDELTVDTKYEKLLTTINHLFNALDNKQIIIFSFFTETIAYLKERLLKDGYQIEVITGATPLHCNGEVLGRYEIIENFKQKKFSILLASDVGGEGLDFQFCQAMLNYDLPYNPMKVEQRIGRIDRFGQQAEKVFIANMFLANTVDERIYDLLYERIDLIHDSIGTFEPIIGKELVDFQQELISGSLSESQQEQKANAIQLAIEKAKVEKEQFELQRNELYGDESFQSIINGITAQNDFLKPSDAAKVTAYFLELNNVNYKVINNEKLEFSMPSKMKEQLIQFLRKPGNEGNQDEIEPILKKNKMSFQFNGSNFDDTSEIFIPITGCWIRFILNELEQDSVLYRVFRLTISSDDLGLPSGSYCMPIFSIEITGLQEMNHLAIVPVNQETGEYVEVNYLEFSKTLSRVNEIEEVGLHFFSHEEAIEEGQFTIEEYLSVALDEMQFEQDVLVATRIQAIEAGSSVRISRIQQTLNDYLVSGRGDERYIRMLEGRIENERKRAKEKIAALQGKQKLAYTTQLIGLIDVVVRERV